MEQHPIPQNVSSYQFKLVGDMTLKQFFQVAGGVIIALIFYSSPLLPIIRLPLAGISILLGVGLAFLPFEERPLEKWIVSFFRAIYTPTIFNWQRGSVSTKLFQDESTAPPNPQTDVALKDYLAKTNQTVTAHGNLDKAEGTFLKNITGIFESGNKTVSQPTQPAQPVSTPSQNIIKPPQIIRDIKIPENNSTPIQNKQMPITQEQPLITNPPVNPITTSVQPIMAGTNIIPASQAMFSVDAAPPSPPTYPNVVVGQIVDQDRRMIEGAIMEIRDSAGRPIRALRSNKVGHFLTVTQLDNGKYEIIIEKDGYEFIPLSFEATGSIISPILIRGKRLSPLIEMPEVPVKPVYSIN